MIPYPPETRTTGCWLDPVPFRSTHLTPAIFSIPLMSGHMLGASRPIRDGYNGWLSSAPFMIDFRRMFSRPSWFAALLCCIALPASAFTAFPIQDIRIEGLGRMSAGTVFNYLPVRVGDRFDGGRSAEAIRALYKTGLFEDIRLEREGNVLVVYVEERPSIAEIAITGNKDIAEEPLRAGLRQIGLDEGQVFDRSILDRVEQELHRQYFARGKYSARVTTTVTPMARNRVSVNIEVSEGKVARITHIGIVGNQAVNTDDLLDRMNLSSSSWHSFLSGNDKYSKPRLGADLEAIRSYYLDRGFLRFNIDSAQVSITPDRHDIYVTVNIHEGDVYTIKDVRVAGDLVVSEEELLKLVTVARGETFSRKKMVETTEAIGNRLGDEGYAFANINSVPDVDEATKEVGLTFFVDPGQRVYVNRINVRGNYRTRDEVVRREMRQMESSWYVRKAVDRSKQRVSTLGYFETTDVELNAVPGTTDQVDLTYTVKEKPSGNLLAGIGFSQSQGLILSGSINQENFLGTGKRVSISVNNSDINTVYRFSFTDPYYTVDGVSRGFGLRYQETDASQANISDYTLDELGASVTFGLPLNEYDRIFATLDLQQANLKPGDEASAEVLSFADTHGDEYWLGSLKLGWKHDTRDSAYFPNKGELQRLNADVVLPGSDLTFYTMNYRHTLYFPFLFDSTLALKGNVGYGAAYGDSGDELPFFRNFYAGGVKSVRGYNSNTIGPVDSTGDPLGGAFKTVGNAEILFKSPFNTDENMRMGLFFDVGSVYADAGDFDPSDLRMSVGGTIKWFTVIGPIAFNLALPVNHQSSDKRQSFQFTLGVDL